MFSIISFHTHLIPIASFSTGQQQGGVWNLGIPREIKSESRARTPISKALVIDKRRLTFARILNRFSCTFLVSLSCFRTMDNLQLIIHDIAMTPTNRRYGMMV